MVLALATPAGGVRRSRQATSPNRTVNINNAKHSHALADITCDLHDRYDEDKDREMQNNHRRNVAIISGGLGRGNDVARLLRVRETKKYGWYLD